MSNPKLRFKREDGTEFPEWEETSFGGTCTGFEYGMNVAACDYDGINKYIRITDIDDSSHRYIAEKAVSPSGKMQDKYIVMQNDILFARTGASVGKTYLYKESDGLLFFAGFLIRANVKAENNAYFIFSQSLTYNYKSWVMLTSMRTGQQGINAKEYKEYKFYSPCLEEQQKIADLLSSVDEVIAQSEAEVSNLQQQKKAAMQKIFSQEVRFKREDGTEFPEWGTTSLNDVCDIVGGGTPSTENKDYWDGNIQWFTPSEIGKSKYASKSARTISQIGFEKSSARKLPTGTILLTSRATLGEMAITTEECTTNQGFQSLVPRKIYGEYLYYLQPTIKNYCYKKACGSTFNEISKGELGKCKIPYPHLEEQKTIANFLSAYDEAISYAKQELDKWKELKKGLLQQMFV